MTGIHMMPAAMKDEAPFLPDAPNIPGLTFRRYRGAADLGAMLAVHDGCRAADRIDPYSVCYRLPNLPANEYAQDVALSFADDSEANVLLAEAAGQVIAHSRLEWWDSYEGARETRVYLTRAWVVPEWRGRGIGTALLHWAEVRARTPNGDGLAGELAANASEGEVDARALLEHEGYRLVFLSPELAYDDLANLPTAETPEGFVIRPLEPQQHLAVARALIEANAPPESLEARLAGEEAEWTAFAASCDPRISRIAWYGDGVAGLYLCRSQGECGDVAQVAVRPAYRLRGLSRALMFHCLHAMREQGLTTVRVFTSAGIDPDEPPSGPLAMYQRFGFHVIARHYRYRKPL